MAYVGNQPVPQATQTRDRFVATSGQTSFATSGYTPNFVDVYLDGVKLDSSEYTATNGSDVILASGASTGQIMEVVAFSSFDVADIRNMTQPLGLKNYTTTERNALTGIGAGDTIYNSTVGSIQFYDGTNWISTNLIPSINSISGSIYNGSASTLTLVVTNATDTVDVSFYEGVTLLATVSGASVLSGSVSVSVPAAVYGQTTGDTISIGILNEDGTPSSNKLNKTVLATPTGGTKTTSGSYVVHTFTSSSSFVVPSGLSLTGVEYLVVAGGGTGGTNGGGGGAGGYRSSVSGESSGGGNSAETSVSLSAGSYTVTVGAGGSGAGQYPAQGSAGSNTVFNTITSAGGGVGGSEQHDNGNGQAVGGSGGSGGGGGYQNKAGGSGTSGQGYAGGSSTGGTDGRYGGGGGGGAVGESPASAKGGDGGTGVSSSITGSATYRAGGGGGGHQGAVQPGTGGTGGGGNGISNSSGSTAGTANTGGGGGGASGGSGYSSNGGSGVVIIRYQL